MKTSRTKYCNLVGLLLLPLLAACATAPTGREQVNGILWIQHSAEYAQLSRQVFAQATARLEALAARGETAALEQADRPPAVLATLPTAIVVDLDETILDNSYYQARRALAELEYGEPSWQMWMSEAKAPALPGAVEFLRAASAAGHRVFYVTNRSCVPMAYLPGVSCPAKGWTQLNLRELGLPGADDPEVLMLRGERAEWASSDKTTRRAEIATRYRIIAMVGDDLRDFTDRDLFAARETELSSWFGDRWFLLPNPLYGSWERALLEGACTPSGKTLSEQRCAEANTKRRYERLKVWPKSVD